MAEVYVTPYPDFDYEIQVSTTGGNCPVWAPEGQKLYYQESSDGKLFLSPSRKLLSVDLSGLGAAPVLPNPQLVFETAESIDVFDVAPSGDRFLLRVYPIDREPIRVLLNWAE